MGLQGSTGLEECDQGTYLWQADKARQGLEDLSLIPFSACACCAVVTPGAGADSLQQDYHCFSLAAGGPMDRDLRYLGSGTASVEVSLASFHSFHGIQED